MQERDDLRAALLQVERTLSGTVGLLGNFDYAFRRARARHIRAAAKNGWIDEKRMTLEILTSIRRAGADMILTYHARDVAKWMKA